MKIAVITMHAVKNYGSVLQTYATQTVFEKMDLDVEIINYIRKKNLYYNLLNTWTENDRGVKKIIKKIVLSPTVKKWKSVFGGYLNLYIKTSSLVYSSEKNLLDYPIESDIFCTGSDQVWNSGWNKGIEKPFYLTFVPDNVPKIALAASIGKTELEETEINYIEPYLKKYNFISMREKSGLNIIQNMGIKNCGFCLDPTLLLSKEEWLNHAKPFSVDGNYVLIYQLNRDKKFDDFAVEFAKRKNLKLMRICTRYDQIRLSGKAIVLPEVQELISIFNGAEYVLTNSFHATAFCINLNKEFISINPNEYSSRIGDILKLFGLENRHLMSYEQYDIAEVPTNYVLVNKKLTDSRNDSIELVKKMVKDCISIIKHNNE